MASVSLLSGAAKRLQGKVAIITGGASGIGETTAKLFAQHGAKVVIVDIQDAAGEAVLHSIGPSNSTYVHCDVTNEDHVRAAVDTAVSTYGKLDIMFNNAGITGDLNPPITDNRRDDFERVMRVNVTGVFLGMKHAARVMIPNRRGVVLSTASMASVLGGITTHAYTSSKHAVVGLTRNLAAELGQFGIRVNCLSPFGLATPLTTQQSNLDDAGIEEIMRSVANLKGVDLRAEDVANAALFLASDEAKYVTGQNLLIDGGFSIVNPAMKFF